MAHYIDNDKFLEEIIKSKEQDELTPLALEYIMLIMKGVTSRLYYKNPMDKEDVMAIAMETVLKYWRSFKPEKGGNAFSYYTQMIKNGLSKGWNDLHPIRKVNQISINNIDIEGW